MTIIIRAPGLIVCNFQDGCGESPCGRYRWEFSWRFGPTFLKKNGEPLKVQPSPGRAAPWSPPWAAWQAWFDEFKKTHERPVA